jgi:NADP-dependent 3-hydroxy acid dehydrogenase YdfG
VVGAGRKGPRPAVSRPVRRFDGQIAIVTGAASGIGNQIAQDLVTRGARVFGVDVQAEPLQEVPGNYWRSRATSPTSRPTGRC